jgi:chitin disaccharide deacetylase
MAVPNSVHSARIFTRLNRRVVLHADDFGMNRAVTDGIVRGFTAGVLTATSLLANAPFAKEALTAWRRLETLHSTGRLPSAAARRELNEPAAPFELGIHLNLTQGRPLTEKTFPAELLDGEGRFRGVGFLFRHFHRRNRRFEGGLRTELAAQVDFLIDHGRQPTHVNGHQYIELLPGLRGVLGELLARQGIRSLRVAREARLARTTLWRGMRVGKWGLGHVKRFYAARLSRAADRWEMNSPAAYFGTCHAGMIDLQLMRQFLQIGLGRGLIEIGLHPATLSVGGESDSRDGWNDPLALHRPGELELVTSQSLVELLRASGASLGRLAPLPAALREAA